MEVEKGSRIRFLRHGEPDPAPLEPGTEGTVSYVGMWSDTFSKKGRMQRQIGVTWDNGRGLGLIEGVDDFEVLDVEK